MDTRQEKDMSNSRDHPARLGEEEAFVIFDVIDKHGSPEEAQEMIKTKLHLPRYHRKTVTGVFNIGIELSRREQSALNVLTTQEVDEIAEKVGYGVSHSRVVELHRLYQLWKIDRREETEKRNIDAVLLTLEERQLKVWFLLRFKHWDEEKIAEKLRAPLRDIQYEIKEIEIKEQLERHKTKEESKMEQSQSMVNLPPWVNQAQREHLEGREQRDELGEGIGVVTYPGGIGIRQQLEFFKGCFPEIAPQSHTFGHPLDEIIMAQLHGHLRDEAFWSRAEDFREKAKKCDALLDAAHEKFTSAGEKLIRLSASGLARITSGWERQVVYQALGPPLGLKNLPRYLVDIIAKEGGSTLTYYELLYSGPDAADAEKAKQIHQQLVEDFKQTEEFSLLVGLMKDLQNLRPQILARIDQCLRGREYSYNYCPDCPADQARKMLTSKEE